MKRFSFSTAAFAAVLVLGLSACQQTTDTSGESQDTGGFTNDAPVERSVPPLASDLGTVYFDFDSSRIRTDARDVLKKNAEALRSSGAGVTVEGHCDERGDEEYNLALGERRANSVKSYLVDLGVNGNQIRTISYGESKPAVVGSGESAWQWNRRAEFRSR